MTYVTLEINVFNLLLGKEMIKRSILHTVLNKNKNSQSVEKMGLAESAYHW